MVSMESLFTGVRYSLVDGTVQTLTSQGPCKGLCLTRTLTVRHHLAETGHTDRHGMCVKTGSHTVGNTVKGLIHRQREVNLHSRNSRPWTEK